MKGQSNIFGVMIGGSILLLVVGMVLALTYMFLAQTDSIVGGLNTTISSATNVFTGVAGTAYTLSQAHPLSLTTFKAVQTITQTNTTLVNTNTTQNITVNSTFYNGASATLTYCFNNTNNSITSLSFNGHLLRALPAQENCTTNASIQSYMIVGSNYVTFTSNDTRNNLKNITLTYGFFAANTSYVRNIAVITPTYNGTYQAVFTYASAGVDTDNAVAALGNVTDAIDLFPQWLTMVVFGTIMVGLLGLVVGIVVFVKQGGLIGGGLQ